jgi:hypothetical protein
MVGRKTRQKRLRPQSGLSPRVAACMLRGIFQCAGENVRKKKPVDPVLQQRKNHAYRIGWLIALAGIICGFVMVALKNQ